MDLLEKFFNENDVRIGKDFQVIPPVHYLSLNDAFYNYFLSCENLKDTFHFLYDNKKQNRENLAFNFTGDKRAISMSILSFHRFIELHFKYILQKINPLLAVNFLDSKLDVFEYLHLELDVSKIKTVEFNGAWNRLKKCFKKYDKGSTEYKTILQQYEFVLENDSIECIKQLSKWRNRIMHNGTTIPNILAYDYFISQRVIPFVDKIFCADKTNLKNYEPHFFRTATGINIIEEFLEVKISLSEISQDNKSHEFWRKFFKIFHLKELGRCSYHHGINGRNIRSFLPFQMLENENERVERFANSEKDTPYFHDLKTCNCCGNDSLVVYRNYIRDIPWASEDYSYWFKCYNCDYMLKRNVEDPYYFGLSEAPIFPSNDDE